MTHYTFRRSSLSLGLYCSEKGFQSSDNIVYLQIFLQNMGGISFYKKYEISELEADNLNDRKMHLVWLDQKIGNQENTYHLKKLKEFFMVNGFDSFEAANYFIKNKPKGNLFRMICSSSLDSEVFDQFQKQPRILKMILFCQYSEKAEQLQSKYKKIKKVLFSILKVKKELEQWVLEDESHIYLYEDAEKLNLFTFNYRAMTDYPNRPLYIKQNQEYQRKVGKQHFLELASKFFPLAQKSINKYSKTYILELKQADRQEMVLQFLFDKEFDFFLSLPTQLLQKSSNPLKLAYIYQPVKDIYESIKSKFSKRQPNTHKKIYFKMDLNQNERQKLESSLKLSKLIQFTSFVKGHTTSIQADDSAFVFEVNLPEIYNQCPGFVVDKRGQEVVINLGNCFKISSFSRKSKRVEADLVGVLANSFQEEGLQSLTLHYHHKNISSCFKKYDGQLLPLIVSKNYSQAKQLLSQLIEYGVQNKDPHASLKYNLQLLELQYKYPQTSQIQARREIEQKYDELELVYFKKLGKSNFGDSDIKAYLSILESILNLAFEFNMITKFNKTYQKIIRYCDIKLLEQKHPSIYFSAEANRHFLQLNDHPNIKEQPKCKSLLQDKLEKLFKLGRTYLEYDAECEYSSTTFQKLDVCIIMVYELLERYSQANQELDNLLKIIKICTQKSEIMKKVEQLKDKLKKVVIEEAQNEQIRSLIDKSFIPII